MEVNRRVSEHFHVGRRRGINGPNILDQQNYKSRRRRRRPMISTIIYNLKIFENKKCIYR